MSEQTARKATITLDTASRDRQFPVYQLSINAVDDKGCGLGYRLMGPKYVGRSRNLQAVELAQRDADEIRTLLDAVFPATEPADHRAPTAKPDPTTADDPTPLRWGLGDVLWGDDGAATVCLSGPNLEPYWLELEPERAAALRDDLAPPAVGQPAEAQPADPPLTPAERQFLTYALDLAVDSVVDGDTFTSEAHAALAKFRRMAGEQP
ncbi:hypothetical protein AB0D99_10500 [Streptomyces sp. NPDC047971]|uniref:hypothetical protein n=1 Tax=Streptomyces sp. NPDC047971 TaxID=3154499 RepID=UPI0033C285BE